MKHAHASFFFAGCLMLFSGIPSEAANAAFSEDGKTVFAIRYDSSNQVERIDVASGAAAPMHLALGKDDLVAGLAAAKDGQFFLVTKHALWQWKPETGKTHWIEAGPEKADLTDVAFHPGNGELLVSTYSATEAGFCYKRKGDKNMIPVNIRYPPAHVIDSPAFLPDGSFLFGAYGDMWHGTIERTTESADPAGAGARETLVAYRYAPMATRETYEGTPSQTGIAGIAVGRKKAYVNFCRMGGSGWGWIQRLDLPVQESGRSLNGAAETARTLESVEEVGMTAGGWTRLCGSADGRRIYFSDGPGDARGSLLIVDDDLPKR